MPALSYDEENEELRNSWPWFSTPDAPSVQYFQLHPNVTAGTKIQPKMHIGWIVWQDGTKSNLLAPADCAGTVATVNQAFRYDRVHQFPSQWWLRLG